MARHTPELHALSLIAASNASAELLNRKACATTRATPLVAAKHTHALCSVHSWCKSNLLNTANTSPHLFVHKDLKYLSSRFATEAKHLLSCYRQAYLLTCLLPCFPVQEHVVQNGAVAVEDKTPCSCGQEVVWDSVQHCQRICAVPSWRRALSQRLRGQIIAQMQFKMNYEVVYLLTKEYSGGAEL